MASNTSASVDNISVLIKDTQPIIPQQYKIMRIRKLTKITCGNPHKTNILEQDIETLFQSVEESSIALFCKEYAMNNSDFAEKLIQELLLPHGETLEERFISISGEVESCFSHNTHFDKQPKYKPFLNWSIINGRLSRLVRRGEFFAERGLIFEALFLSTTIIEKVSEMYIEDEVWSDQNLDSEIFTIHEAVDLVENIVNSNALKLDMLMELYNEIERLSKMDAHQEYGLFCFDYIQDRIMTKTVETEE